MGASHNIFAHVAARISVHRCCRTWERQTGGDFLSLSLGM